MLVIPSLHRKHFSVCCDRGCSNQKRCALVSHVFISTSDLVKHSRYILHYQTISSLSTVASIDVENRKKNRNEKREEITKTLMATATTTMMMMMKTYRKKKKCKKKKLFSVCVAQTSNHNETKGQDHTQRRVKQRSPKRTMYRKNEPNITFGDGNSLMAKYNVSTCVKPTARLCTFSYNVLSTYFQHGKTIYSFFCQTSEK